MFQLALYGSQHIQHSLSPHLHQYAAELAGIGIKYSLIPCDINEFREHLNLNPFHLLGANVTNPHKVFAYQMCDTLSTHAQKTNAVNTLMWCKTGIHGDNTDVYGFLQGISHCLESASNTSIYHPTLHTLKHVLIVGTGGVTRAILHALSTLNTAHIHILARSRDSINRLRPTDQSSQPTTYHLISELDDTCLPHFDMMILATPPLAMSFYHTTLTPLIHSSPKSRPIIYDLNYGQRSIITKQWAEKLMLQYNDGLMMLVAQGLSSFKQWTKCEVDENLVYQKLHAVL